MKYTLFANDHRCPGIVSFVHSTFRAGKHLAAFQSDKVSYRRTKGTMHILPLDIGSSMDTVLQASACVRGNVEKPGKQPERMLLLKHLGF